MNKFSKVVVLDYSPLGKAHMSEFLRKDPNQVHPEYVKITLNDGTVIERTVGFSMNPATRAQSAQQLKEQYNAKSVQVKGYEGEDWGTYT